MSEVVTRVAPSGREFRWRVWRGRLGMWWGELSSQIPFTAFDPGEAWTEIMYDGGAGPVPFKLGRHRDRIAERMGGAERAYYGEAGL